MTFKQFATGAFYLPARAFSGITSLLLGSTYIDKDGDEQNFRGLFGLTVDAVKFVTNMILDATKFVVRGVSNFIANHQKAISVAFWSSLVVAGAAALTVAFWPAALAAVTSFSIAGVSIASVVGTGFAAQVSAVAAVGAIATSALVYTGAAIYNTITGIRDFFVNRRKAAETGKEGQLDTTADATKDTRKERNPLFDLNAKPTQTATAKRESTSSNSSSEDAAPVQTKQLFNAVPNKAPVVVQEATATTGVTVSM